MNTTSIGRLAEQKAADYLSKEYGYKLLASNWRTRTCEIDLIMQSRDTIHFIEVKYRQNHRSGTGLEAISPNKLARMYNAALEWLEQNTEYQDSELNIAALEVSGKKLEITNFISTINYDLKGY